MVGHLIIGHLLVTHLVAAAAVTALPSAPPRQSAEPWTPTVTPTPTPTPTRTPTPTPTPKPTAKPGAPYVAVVSAPRSAPALLPLRATVTVTRRSDTAAPTRVDLQRWTGRAWAGAGSARTPVRTKGAISTWTVATTPPTAGTQRYRARVIGAKVTVTTGERRVTAVAAYVPVVSKALTRRDVPYSYRPGCPVPPSSLRRITFTYRTMSGGLARGGVVVRLSAVKPIVAVFGRAFSGRFPLQKVVPVDAYYRHGLATPTQSDIAQMADGDTMAFNCRSVTGNPYRISEHSYGDAIDINCRQNPYVTGSRVYPGGSKTYLNRRRYRPGMILPQGVVATEMRRQRWLWGARWADPDYQHFSSNGG